MTNQTNNLKTLTINDKIQHGANFYKLHHVERGLAWMQHTTCSQWLWLNADNLAEHGYKRAGVR